MNKFDGSDPSRWVTKMEHYFPLHGITDDLYKLKVGAYIWVLNVGNGGKWYKNSYKDYIP
jgi:hypothetical protein